MPKKDEVAELEDLKEKPEKEKPVRVKAAKKRDFPHTVIKPNGERLIKNEKKKEYGRISEAELKKKARSKK